MVGFVIIWTALALYTAEGIYVSLHRRPKVLR
jgi:EamA domain-containing membrane protein RarD